MFAHERKALEHIANELRSNLGDDIAGVYAFGSRVRGDHSDDSDFDFLILVRRKDVDLDKMIISIIVDIDTDDVKQSLNEADEIVHTIDSLRTTMIKELNTK